MSGEPKTVASEVPIGKEPCRSWLAADACIADVESSGLLVAWSRITSAKPYGPGWALVGDAGYLKDPCTAEGITDAFHSAELLADAIDSGLSGRRPLNQALAYYEQERNKGAFPLFEFTCQLATLAPPPPEMQQLLAALQGNQEQTDRFFGIFAQTVSVPELFAAENVQKDFGGGSSRNRIDQSQVHTIPDKALNDLGCCYLGSGRVDLNLLTGQSFYPETRRTELSFVG